MPDRGNTESAIYCWAEKSSLLPRSWRYGMQAIPEAEQSLVLSYLGLRKCIGIIGMTLPFVLVFGRMLLGGYGTLDSISDYYYSTVRDVFVGSLYAVAV